MFLSGVFAKSKSNEEKSPLCGAEKNMLPLNNGLKMNLIYKEKTEGRVTVSEILQHVIKEEEWLRITASWDLKAIVKKNNAVKESSSHMDRCHCITFVYLHGYFYTP
ncbi:PREDICTED: LOW QUALITY PROTEIN: 39S ribosomal protein L33, mitochondrial [Galeopterus variegatus]|uniref:LOW QUALITY PROTEIN: 39S ribosomal protein L33, mitochondrial n=1 Tax=Galeopterus variegatus TaxID=482537 RepID=A0ABM0RGI2_GALVR|nr:PREDICTED: LOW QUALITY PROTEIN: 39S ribosomal protein L33, mitochondrial [Galeopterus variegatus]